MADPTQGQEPSMEDILASIRRIIDEDDRKAAVSTPEAAGLDGNDDEVLELTEYVETAPDTEDEESWEAVAEPEVLPEETVAFALEPESEAPVQAQPDTIAQSEEAMTMSTHERLVSDAALTSAAAALGTLARASERDPLEGVPKGRPVEELVMELLKPMLREWLDQNLPAVVERIVEREVRYLSRRLEGDGRD